MIDAMFNQGSLPVLERLVQFTGQRQRVLTNNIANLPTPYYKPADLDIASFQSSLADAIDRRRQTGNLAGELSQPTDTRQLRFTPHGLDAEPAPTHDGVLFHDQNNRDLERTMQRLAENTLAHSTAIELIRSEMATLRMAIRERL